MGGGGGGKRKDRGTAGQTRLNSGSWSDTSRASSATFGKLEEQHIQSIRNREKVKTDFVLRTYIARNVRQSYSIFKVQTLQSRFVAETQ